MRNSINLKKNATLILPEYLKEIKSQEDCINAYTEVCSDSLEQFYLLKDEFIIYNSKYSYTDEFKKMLKKLNDLENKILNDIEYSKKLLYESKKLEQRTKQKIYKIVRK